MGRIVTEAEARRDLERLLDEARYPGEHVVIERDGEPVAVLVSVAEARAMREESERAARREFAKYLEDFRAQYRHLHDMDEDELNELVDDAIAEVRAAGR